MKNVEKPVVNRNTKKSWEDERETHPAYGMIGASRVSGGIQLFGSDFQHRDFMTVRVYPAELSRSLSEDRPYASSLIPFVEVAMSEAQWATFVSTPSSGMGVPCTLQSVCDHGRGNGDVPGIDRTVDRRSQFRKEMQDNVNAANDALKAALAELQKLKISGKAMKVIQDTIDVVDRELRSNTAFVAQQFDEHMETTVERAKIEVSSYVTSAVHRAGLKALGADSQRPFELMDGKTEDEPS